METMTFERLDGMVEEVREAENLLELKELWCINDAAGCNCAEVVREIKARLPELRLVGKPVEIPLAPVEQIPPSPRSKPPVAAKWYKLVSKDVSWSTVPQVHAIMDILVAHGDVGSIWSEDQIVEMMRENRPVLNTVQPCERIWKYYKGKHARGLEEHGNIEEVK